MNTTTYVYIRFHGEIRKIFIRDSLSSGALLMCLKTARRVVNHIYPGPFLMLNSAEHEIFHANKSQITNNANSFLLNIAKHDFFSNKFV